MVNFSGTNYPEWSQTANIITANGRKLEQINGKINNPQENDPDYRD